MTTALATMLTMSVAAWPPGDAMIDATTEALATAGHVRAQMDHTYGYVDGVAVLGAVLDPGRHVDWSRPLDGGVGYAIIASGDTSALDVDLLICDELGSVVARDEARRRTPVLMFTPPRTGRYTFRLRLYDAPDTAFCTMVLLRDRGRVVATGRLAEALESALEAGTLINRRVGADFHDLAGEWCLFGSVLREGEATTVDGLDLFEAEHILAAVGDDRTRDIDLYLSDAAGRPVLADDRDDAVPLLRPPSDSGGCSLRIRRYAGPGTSMVLTLILEAGN